MTRVFARPARWFARGRMRWVGAAALIVAIAATMYAAAGDLDSTFDTDGKVTLDFGSNLNDQANAIKFHSGPILQGRLIVAGSANGSNTSESADFGLARFTANGAPDTTFGGTGKVNTDFSSRDDWAYAVEVLPDEKVLAAGCASRPTGNQFNPTATDFALARYNVNGSPDIAFDSDGKLTTVFTGVNSCALALVRQTNGQNNGKFVAAGYAGSRFALVRYTTTGAVDLSFGGGSGFVTTPFGATNASAYSIVEQPDHKLLVAGATNRTTDGVQDFAIARYDENGTLDSSFGTNGTVVLDFGADDHGFAVVLQPDNKFVVAGYTEAGVGIRDFALARFDDRGNPDGGFGTSGKVITDFVGRGDSGYALVRQPDGKLVAAGYGTNAAGSVGFALARYSDTGALDTTFGTGSSPGGGKVITPATPAAFGVAIALLQQPDGKLVAAGSVINSGTSSGTFDFAVNRYVNSVSANTPPTLTNVSVTPPAIHEGDPVSVSALFTDPNAADQFDVHVDWGDGSAPTDAHLLAGVRHFDIPHVYLNNPIAQGIFTITLTLTDSAGGSVTTTRIVGVSNVPPTVTASVSATTVVIGQLTELTGSFIDPGTSDPHAVSVNWGDDPNSFDDLGSAAAGEPFEGFHAYSSTGQFTITVFVYDDVAYGEKTLDIHVDGPLQSPTTTVLGSSSFLDSSTLGQTVTFTATVNGTSPTGTVTFFVDGLPLTEVLLEAPSPTFALARLPIGTLPAGGHSITASYNGDANNRLSSSLTPQTLVVSETNASGTAARAILEGVADNRDGHFGSETSLEVKDDDHLDIGSSFGAGFTLANGPNVRAYSSTGATAMVAGAARAVSYRTIFNHSDTAKPDQITNAVLDGTIDIPNLGHAAAAVYVIDADVFHDAVNASNTNLQEFLLSNDTLQAYQSGSELDLSLKRLFTAVKATDFRTITESTSGTPINPSFTIEPWKAVVVMFDISVFAPSGATVNFASTLKPAPVFLTDRAGNPSPLTLAGPASSVPPAPAALTLAPAATTALLATPVTITATATSASGAPVPSTTVFFTITSGPNAQPVVPAVTDVNGHASFTYAAGSLTGTDQIQANIGALLSNLAAVTWTAGPLDHLSISPSSATIAAGGSQSFTTQAFDQFNNSRGDVTAGTTFTIAPNGSCTGATCTASIAGAHTVTATYNTKVATAALNVTGGSAFTYAFQGFFEPIDMSTPTVIVWNTVKAGQAVAIKWRLTRDGVPILDPASFVGVSSSPIACSSSAGSIDDAIDQTAIGSSGLQGNGDGTWQFNWQTLKSEKGTCRAVAVKFDNGTTSPVAYFKLK